MYRSHMGRNLSTVIIGARRTFSTSSFRAAATASQNTRASSAFLAACTAGVISLAVLSSQEAHNASIDYKKLREDILAAIEKEDEKRGDGTSIGPTLVRLAWHCSGTYSIFDKTGGSNAASMRFSPESDWGANAGLKGARDFLEPVSSRCSRA